MAKRFNLPIETADMMSVYAIEERLSHTLTYLLTYPLRHLLRYTYLLTYPLTDPLRSVYAIEERIGSLVAGDTMLVAWQHWFIPALIATLDPPSPLLMQRFPKSCDIHG